MIDSIRLQNFRSYSDESFEFETGVNIVVGPNASGKTNLLEAVYILALGNSYRARDTELVRHKRPWARVEGYFGSQDRVLKLKRDGDTSDKTLEIDNKPYKRLSLDRTLPLVIFEPNHLQLITRGPEQRREYFDDLLERSRAGYKTIRANYKRTLAQRNALLKRGSPGGKHQLFAWNIRLSELGAEIANSRQTLIDEINKNLGKTYSQIAHQKSSVAAEYEARFPIDNYASRLLSKLESSTQVDFERGFTAYGPHREDIAFYLNKQALNETASRGETRSLLLALKIFELGLIEKIRGSRPLFLLDDVFSELDSARRRALVDFLADHQSIITTTDADAVVDYFAEGHNLIALGSGTSS